LTAVCVWMRMTTTYCFNPSVMSTDDDDDDVGVWWTA
jgi:hypothetical protein